MRFCVAAVFAVALGCSSNSFDVNAAPDSAADDTSAAADTTAADTATPPSETSDTSGDTSVSPPDSKPPPDAMVVTEVAPPPDTGSGMACARTGDCGVNEYCKYTGCVAVGVCRVLSPLPGPRYDPVCGCDGSTFWNREYAYVHSAPILHEGPCVGSERKPCSGAGTLCDETDSLCVVQLPEASTCSISTPSGGCWRLPTGTTCGTAPGPPMLPCVGSICMSHCTAVKSKKAFYPASCTI